MKKALLMLAMGVFAAAAYAGAIKWGLDYDDYSMPTDSVAYLVSVSDTVTVDSITAHIDANGLDVAGLKSAAWSSADSSFNDDDQVYSNTQAKPGTQYYLAVFILNADESSVIVADQINTVIPTMSGLEADDPDDIDSPTLYVWTASSTNAQSTATNGVPEPTALALLALGIAGLALRRRA